MECGYYSRAATISFSTSGGAATIRERRLIERIRYINVTDTGRQGTMLWHVEKWAFEPGHAGRLAQRTRQRLTIKPFVDLGCIIVIALIFLGTGINLMNDAI